ARRAARDVGPATQPEEMADRLRVALEIGPKGKKVAAVAPDWPGLGGGGTAEGAAGERPLAYGPRHPPGAGLAGAEARPRGRRGRTPIPRPSAAPTWSSDTRAPARPTSGASRSRSRPSTGRPCPARSWRASWP